MSDYPRLPPEIWESIWEFVEAEWKREHKKKFLRVRQMLISATTFIRRKLDEEKGDWSYIGSERRGRVDVFELRHVYAFRNNNCWRIVGRRTEKALAWSGNYIPIVKHLHDLFPHRPFPNTRSPIEFDPAILARPSTRDLGLDS